MSPLFPGPLPAVRRRLPLWPGLLLNLLLPGSGFTYLGRPWWHLGALALTLLDWLAAWLLVLYVGYSGLSDHTALPTGLSETLVYLAFAFVLGSYVALTWGYVRAARRPGRSRLSGWARGLLIGLHAAVVVWLAWPYLFHYYG